MGAFARALYGLYVPEQRSHRGQGLVEYALIIAFIAVVVIVAMVFLRGQIGGLFSKVGNSLSTGAANEPLAGCPAPQWAVSQLVYNNPSAIMGGNQRIGQAPNGDWCLVHIP